MRQTDLEEQQYPPGPNLGRMNTYLLQKKSSTNEPIYFDFGTAKYRIISPSDKNWLLSKWREMRKQGQGDRFFELMGTHEGFKLLLRQYYQWRDQTRAKKEKKLNETSPRAQRAVSKLRMRYPHAESDMEAILFSMLDADKQRKDTETTLTKQTQNLEKKIDRGQTSIKTPSADTEKVAVDFVDDIKDLDSTVDKQQEIINNLIKVLQSTEQEIADLKSVSGQQTGAELPSIEPGEEPPAAAEPAPAPAPEPAAEPEPEPEQPVAQILRFPKKQQQLIPTTPEPEPDEEFGIAKVAEGESTHKKNFSTAKLLAQDVHHGIEELENTLATGNTRGAYLENIRNELYSAIADLESLGFEYDADSPNFLRPLTVHVPVLDLDSMQQKVQEDLRKWFKEKWVRFNPQGKIMGPCARGSDSEGKPKCLPQSKAHSLGKKGRASAAARKRREDPDPERRGPAKNVATKKKSNEGLAEEKKPDFVKAGNMRPLTMSGKQIPGAVSRLEKVLLKAKEKGVKLNYNSIDAMMQAVCKKHHLTGDELHDEFVAKHHMTPDNWIAKQKQRGNHSPLNEFDPQTQTAPPELVRDPPVNVLIYGRMPQDFTAQEVWDALPEVLPQEYPYTPGTQIGPTQKVTVKIAREGGAVITTKPKSVALKLVKTLQTYGIKSRIV